MGLSQGKAEELDYELSDSIAVYLSPLSTWARGVLAPTVAAHRLLCGFLFALSFEAWLMSLRAPALLSSTARSAASTGVTTWSGCGRAASCHRRGTSMTPSRGAARTSARRGTSTPRATPPR